MESAIWGKNKKKEGITPAIALVNPKLDRNVATVIRLASCFGVKQVWYTGNRVPNNKNDKSYRLPREERMRGYNDVQLRQFDYFFDEFDKDVTPVAVELRPNAELLPHFEHPEKPLYVFGPEDGGLQQIQLRHCHRFVVIPLAHCLNLATAVSIILHDRLLKRQLAGVDPVLPMRETLKEDRVWTDLENSLY